MFVGGAYAPPFCAVQRLLEPFNASSASWKTLSIRRREVFKGFGRRQPDSYQAHEKQQNPLIISGFCAFILVLKNKLNLMEIIHQKNRPFDVCFLQSYCLMIHPTTDRDSIFRKSSVFSIKSIYNVIFLVNLQLIGVEMWPVDPLVRLPRSRPLSRRPNPHSPLLLLLAKRETASRTLQCPWGQNVERTCTLTYTVKQIIEFKGTASS